MKFFFNSIRCWILHSGHVWTFQSFSFEKTGKAVSMKCVKCGAETVNRVSSGIGK